MCWKAVSSIHRYGVQERTLVATPSETLTCRSFQPNEQRICTGLVCRKQPSRLNLRLFKKVLVQASELDSPAYPDSYSMFDHQIGQAFAIEKDNPLRKVLDEVARLRAEGGSSYKDTLARAKTDKAANKSLHARSPDGVRSRIALGLNVNSIEPQPVLIDHAIDTPVTRSSQLGSGILM